MSYFAKVTDGIVEKVIKASAEYMDNYVDDSPGEWIQTSYNTHGGVHYEPNTNTPSADQSKALRYNYAGIGYSYDTDRDAFIPPKPYNSWTLNESTCLWEPPVAYPEDYNTVLYSWNEETQSWDTE